ncbi:hypothetical protein UFOVP199_8 [uncultured Caudovirales phage]|uniref:Holliday junction resolvase n=1 Tax=uncultured Caudovirales phage TaxID=2100421 RepID=A0A6J7WHH8_9CAUD|nr:hypothetical protein UFOVP199_8 [uncultured Caudovirales phage]
MSQHRKHRGYDSQRIVADYLAKTGWPYAESTGAGRSGTDVTGTPGIDWEVKARRGFNITAAMDQLADRGKEGVAAVAVIRPDGYGPARIEQWPALMTLKQAVELLRQAGYGDPL